MPYSVVPGCANYRKKKKEKLSTSYPQLRADVEWCKEWLRVIKNLKFDKNTPESELPSLRVCSLNLMADDYKWEMKSELLRDLNKRSLKTYTVPTLFGSDFGHGVSCTECVWINLSLSYSDDFK